MKILKIISLAIVCAIAANAVVFGAMNTGLGYELVVYGSIAFTELMIIYWFVKWILGNNEQNYGCDYCDDEDDYTGFDDEDSSDYGNYYKSGCDCGCDSSHTARVDENVEDADIPDSDGNSGGALSKEDVKEENSHNDVEKAFDNLVATAKSF